MAGWCEWIQVDNQRVMSRCQMSREATLVENRNKLIDAGLIEFQRGKKEVLINTRFVLSNP